MKKPGLVHSSYHPAYIQHSPLLFVSTRSNTASTSASDRGAAASSREDINTVRNSAQSKAPEPSVLKTANACRISSDAMIDELEGLSGPQNGGKC